MTNIIEPLILLLTIILLVIPASWLGYLIAGNILFWKKYEKDAPLFDWAPVGNWPEIAVLAILDDNHPEPWQAIKSVLNQNYSNKEIIVVANGVRSDTLLTSLEKLNGECFRIIEFTEKVDLTEIYNLAIKLTQAPSIFVAHPGVVLESDVITKLSMQLYQDSRVGVVYATQALEKSKEKWQVYNNIATEIETFKKKASRIYGKLFVHNEKCALFRTNALIDIGGFDTNSTNIIAYAGWKAQTMFWSARFESRAQYSYATHSSKETAINAANAYEAQDSFILRTSKHVLFDKKQRRLVFPYINPILRRFFYIGIASILPIIGLFSIKYLAAAVAVLFIIYVTFLLFIASYSKVRFKVKDLFFGVLSNLFLNFKIALKTIGVFK